MSARARRAGRLRRGGRIAVPTIVLTALLAAVVVPGGRADAAVLNTNTVVLDASGRIIPWTADPGAGYGTVMDLAWDYFLHDVPVDRTNGKPAYFSSSYLDPDTQAIVGWPHNPAGLYAMLTESALTYYAYSGDAAVVAKAVELATWSLDHGMTAATDAWPGVPYNVSGDAGSLTYRGAAFGNSTGSGDGTGVIEPDKIGELGLAWLQLYRFGGDVRFRDAAVHAADVLAAKARPGTASQSPWPFRVFAATGVVREDYGADVAGALELFHELVDLGLGDTATYTAARQSVLAWTLAFPVQNDVWTQYFEDVAIQSDHRSNRNQYDALMFARYLLRHPEVDSAWEAHVRHILTWVKGHFGSTQFGATTIAEQDAFFHAMGSHTARYASVNALLYEATGDVAAREEAYRSFNWATYMTRANGVVIDGPTVGNQWFTDGYGDYVRHFMTGLGAVPQWAPPGRDHLTGSTSVVRQVAYGAGTVAWTTADAAATETLRTTSAPASVTVGGVALAARADLDGEGWTYDAATGALRVRHDHGASVQVVLGGTVPDTTTTSSTTTTTTAPTTTTSATTTTTTTTTSTTTTTTAPTTTTTTTAPPVGLPAPWVAGDVGTVGRTGSASADAAAGAFTVTGGGIDIWGTADEFQFLHRPLTGDGQITARVASLQNTGPWAMAGVMIRETLAAGSRHATVSLTPANGWGLTTRVATNGSSAHAGGGAGAAPGWARLRRVGNTFTAWRSTDGATWTQFGQATIAMGASVEVGLAVSAVNDAALNTAAFTDVALAGGDFAPPTISAVAAAPTGTSGALVSWSTNEPADGVVEYGPSETYGSSTPAETAYATTHSRTIGGLAAATTYHYRVRSRDAAGNTAVSADGTFRTAAAPDASPPSTPQGLSARAVSPTQVILTWTAAQDDVGVTGYQVWRDGTLITTVGGTTATDGALAPASTHSWTVRAVDAAGHTSGPSTPASATTPAATALTVDTSVATNQSTPAATITSPALSTAGPGELLLAFVASDGPRSGTQRFTSVTGGGLTWTLRARVNAQAGVSEVWQAVAPSPLTGVTVTATRAVGSYQGMLAVVAFSGASLTATGATAGASASTGAPTASLVTTRAGSWVWAIGNDWDGATARTVATGQVKVREFLSSQGDTFWVQRTVGPTATAGTRVTINDTAPRNHRWNLVLVEVPMA